MKTKDIRSMGLAYLEVLEGKGAVNKHGHDHVGKEDPDVNNDKKVDSTDKYLLNRRKAISANIRKEEVEDLDEVSSTTIMNYSIKAAQQGTKRVAGQKTADEKMRKKGGYSSTAKVAAGPARQQNEEVEELDELSKKTLGKYVKLAGPDRERRLKSAEKLASVGRDIKSNDPEHANKLFTKAGAEHGKAANRKAGINKAVNKLVGEETNDWPVFKRIQEKLSLPSYKVSGIGDDPHEVTVNYAKDPHTKGATPPEKIDSAASGGEKDFIAKHGGLGGNDSGINAHEYAAKNSVAHTTNVKVAPGRHNDQKIGDKVPPKSKS